MEKSRIRDKHPGSATDEYYYSIPNTGNLLIRYGIQNKSCPHT